MFIFYGFNFAPPMAIIPLFINIISLLVYSIYQKQFFDFVDLESKEMQELKEMEKIQEIQDISSQIDFLKRNDFNISFKGQKLFEDEKNSEDDKEDKYDKKDENDNDSDEEDKKKHEIIINNFSDKFNTKDFNKISNEQQEDSEIEGVEKLINLVGGEDDKNNESPMFSKKDMNLNLKNKRTSRSFNKDKEPKMVEMKIFEDKSN